jgi:hypothetical protein
MPHPAGAEIECARRGFSHLSPLFANIARRRNRRNELALRYKDRKIGQAARRQDAAARVVIFERGPQKTRAA